MEIIGYLILLALIFILLELNSIHRVIDKYITDNNFYQNRLYEATVNTSVGLGNILGDIRTGLVKIQNID